MDSEIEELKELIRQNTKVAEDTNRVVHSMRSAARWGRIFHFAWWLIVLVASGALYYYLFGPYIGQIMQLYGSAQNILQNFHPQ